MVTFVVLSESTVTSTHSSYPSMINRKSSLYMYISVQNQKKSLNTDNLPVKLANWEQ